MKTQWDDWWLMDTPETTDEQLRSSWPMVASLIPKKAILIEWWPSSALSLAAQPIAGKLFSGKRVIDVLTDPGNTVEGMTVEETDGTQTEAEA